MDERNDELNRRRQERQKERAIYASQMKMLKWGMIAMLAVLLICGVAILIAFVAARQPTPQAAAPSSGTQAPTVTTVPPETQPVTPDTVIHFLAGGDLNVTKKVVESGVTTSGYDYTEVFKDVMPLLAGADLSAINLEGNIYDTEYGDKKSAAPEQLMESLRNAGVDLVQMANSMTLKNGTLGLDSTLDSIRANGMEPVGAFASEEEYEKSGGYFLREINGIKIAVVAFTKGGTKIPKGYDYCVNLLYKDYYNDYQKVDTEGINAVLKRIRAQKPDVTIALLHWGSEYNNIISPTQEKICQLMQKGGVDAIIGTHPHYVQKIDYQADKGSVVAYSLGDFLGNAEDKRTRYSVMLDLEITKNGETGEVKITNATPIPLYILDETESGGGLTVLRMREAIAAYENQLINRVPDAVYESMKESLALIEKQIKG